MKKILVLFLLVFCFVYAEKINVINDDAKAIILIDGREAGKQSVYDYSVEPGSHHVSVEKNGVTIYSQVVEIEAGKVKTLNTNNFVEAKTNIANKGSKYVEAERARESRGDLGIGLLWSPLSSGISGKYFFSGKMAIQTSGWLSTQANSSAYDYGIRGIYVLSDSLADNRPISLYSFLGLNRSGSKNGNTELLDESYEIGIGIESKIKKGGDTNNSEAVYSFLLSLLDGSYISLEVLLNRQLSNQVFKYEGIGFSSGLHFYF